MIPYHLPTILYKFGSTALLIAVTNGHGPVAAVLLDNGADVNHANTVSCSSDFFS